MINTAEKKWFLPRMVDQFRDARTAARIIRRGLSETEQKLLDKAAVASAKGGYAPTVVSRKVPDVGLSEFGSSQRNTWMPCPWDLTMIGRVYETDGIFMRAINKYVELTWKNGFSFTGPLKDSKAVAYITKRFEQIALVTGVPIRTLFNSIVMNLILYGNAYVSKVRNQKASGGRVRTTFDGGKLSPVAGYFCQDARWMFMDVALNGRARMYKMDPWTTGTPYWWHPRVYNAKNTGATTRRAMWVPRNMIHIPFLTPGGPYGMPMGWPIIDDLRSLREGEEKLEALIYDAAYGGVHAKVGTDKHQADAGEVDIVNATLAAMPPGGVFTSNERVEIVAIDKSKLTFDIVKGLAYMIKRVAMGLGVSPVSMGDAETANKASSEVVTAEIRNTVKFIQSLIKTFVDEYMINELLLEGGYIYDAYNQTNKVELYIPEIDQEAKFRDENNAMLMFVSSLLTEPEARARLGMGPVIEAERQYLYQEMYPSALPPGDGSVSNTARPANQYGKASAAPTRAKRDASILPPIDTYHAALDSGDFEDWFELLKEWVSLKVGGGNQEKAVRLATEFVEGSGRYLERDNGTRAAYDALTLRLEALQRGSLVELRAQLVQPLT